MVQSYVSLRSQHGSSSLLNNHRSAVFSHSWSSLLSASEAEKAPRTTSDEALPRPGWSGEWSLNSAFSCHRLRLQFLQAVQVVGGSDERGQPAHFLQSAQLHLLQ